MIFHSTWKKCFRIESAVRFLNRKFNILGIESSCDDTSAAVLNDSKQVLGEGHISQSQLHLHCGGVVPNVAFLLHKKHLETVIDESIRLSQLDFKDLEAIAVTVKPGLILSLFAGVDFAKDLCRKYNKPLIPVHHMEAHALTARLTDDVKFPFVVLLISGGHCIIGVVNSPIEFYKLGESLDASPGQSFDKVARRAKLLNLSSVQGLCGGAQIERVALGGDPTALPFLLNYMLHLKNCHFSFSGITTHALKYIEKQEKDLDLEPDAVLPNISDFCASFQWAIARHLSQRVALALQYVDCKNLLGESTKCLVVSGGVASNKFLRCALDFVCNEHGYQLVAPPSKYCTDNGVMVAWNGIEKLAMKCPVVLPTELDSVQPVERCPLGNDLSDDVEETFRYLDFTYSAQLKNFIAEYAAKDESVPNQLEKVPNAKT